VLYAAAAIALPAQTYTALHSFDGTDGASPRWSLVQGLDGNLYGTTVAGGGTTNPGTVFKITPTGTVTTLHSFCAETNCTDGFSPASGVVLATNGEFYGVTYSGGANCAPGGCGTIFSVTSSGTLTTIYSFCAEISCTDGNHPNAGLVQASNGYLYGTTSYGGATNQGTVFKITPSGTLTTIHSFDGTDGLFPSGPLVQDTNGYLYGTTSQGGAYCNVTGCGTVFRMTPSGTLTTLYSFNGTDGQNPVGALVQATNGYLYGATSGGGANSHGTIFKMTPSGTLTPMLYSFCSESGCTDGSLPDGGLVQAPENEDLYGATFYGGTGCGSNGCGTIFKMTPSGTLTTVFRSYCPESGCPYYPGALLQDTNGAFYGATFDGGTGSVGTAYSLSLGLGAFVKPLPTSGAVGSAVKILGSNLTGATSVTFDGIAATFTVVSRYLITTTVPTGATSGTVEVVTPSAALSSNVAFTVP